MQERPFDTIESALEYLTLLGESVEEALHDVERELEQLPAETNPRTVEALEVAVYLTKRLDSHVNKARRDVNDLRMLRRLLFATYKAEKYDKNQLVAAD
jgi:hypothetical protein